MMEAPMSRTATGTAAKERRIWLSLRGLRGFAEAYRDTRRGVNALGLCASTF
jgi:hypothetical protein